MRGSVRRGTTHSRVEEAQVHREVQRQEEVQGGEEAETAAACEQGATSECEAEGDRAFASETDSEAECESEGGGGGESVAGRPTRSTVELHALGGGPCASSRRRLVPEAERRWALQADMPDDAAAPSLPSFPSWSLSMPTLPRLPFSLPSFALPRSSLVHLRPTAEVTAFPSLALSLSPLSLPLVVLSLLSLPLSQLVIAISILSDRTTSPTAITPTTDITAVAAAAAAGNGNATAAPTPTLYPGTPRTSPSASSSRRLPAQPTETQTVLVPRHDDSPSSLPSTLARLWSAINQLDTRLCSLENHFTPATLAAPTSVPSSPGGSPAGLMTPPSTPPPTPTSPARADQAALSPATSLAYSFSPSSFVSPDQQTDRRRGGRVGGKGGEDGWSSPPPLAFTPAAKRSTSSVESELRARFYANLAE